MSLRDTTTSVNPSGCHLLLKEKALRGNLGNDTIFVGVGFPDDPSDNLTSMGKFSACFGASFDAAPYGSFVVACGRVKTLPYKEHPPYVILSVLQSAADFPISMIAGGNHTLIGAQAQSRRIRIPHAM